MKKLMLLLFWSIFCGSYITGFTAHPADSTAKINTGGTHNPAVLNRYHTYITKGLKQLEEDNYHEAAQWFKKAQGFLPNLPDAYLNLGIINIRQGNIEKAMNLLRRAKKTAQDDFPNNSVLFYNLGVCSYINDDYRQAAKYFARAIDTGPSSVEAPCGLQMSCDKIRQKNQYLPAVCGKKSRREAVRDRARSNETGKTLSGRKLSAEELLEKGSQIFRQDTSRAILMMRKSISLQRDNPQAHYRLGVIYDRQGQLPEAARCFKSVLRIDPGFAKAYLNLGSVYGKLKKYKAALKMLKKASKLDGANPKIPYNISMVYIATGDIGKSLSYLKEAQSLCTPRDDEALLEKIRKISQKLKGSR